VNWDPPGPGPEDAREASRLFQGGLILLPILTGALMAGFSVSIRDAVFVAFLLGTLPLLSMAQLPLLRAGDIHRIAAYAGSAAMLAGLALAALLLAALGVGVDALGMGPGGAWPDGALAGASPWAVTAGLAVAVAMVGLAFHVAGERWGLAETPVLRALIPRTGREKALFVVLSLAAGFGEEVVYRGYLLAVLAPLFQSAWVAALVSSMAFSVLHAYQGPVGMVRSGTLGFLFAVALLLHGSLWPLVVVHTGVDLVSGLWLGPRMLDGGDEPPTPDGPQGES